MLQRLEICVDVLITLQTTNLNLLELSWRYKQRYCHFIFGKCALWSGKFAEDSMCTGRTFVQLFVQHVWYNAVWKVTDTACNRKIMQYWPFLSLKQGIFYLLQAVKFSMCSLCPSWIHFYTPKIAESLSCTFSRCLFALFNLLITVHCV